MFIEIIRYGIAGLLTTGFNLLLFYILEHIGLYYLLANIISYYIAVILNYYANYIFVFQNKIQNKNGIVSFIILRSSSLIIDSLLLYLLVDLWEFNVIKSRIGLSFFIILINYIFCKKMIFNNTGGEK